MKWDVLPQLVVHASASILHPCLNDASAVYLDRKDKGCATALAD